MTYEAALSKAWDELEKLSDTERYTIKLLSDTYEVDVKNRTASSVSCNVPTKDYITILLLHYILGSTRNKYSPSGEWVSFKEIKAGEIYYPAYHESVITPLLRKYGGAPEKLLDALNRFTGKKIDEGDAGIEIVTFKDIAIRVVLWKSDEEFGPEATILFDKNITGIFSMEDVVVFSRFVTHSL